MQERFNQYYLIERLASKPLRSVFLAHRVNDASQKVVVKIFDAACLNLDQENERFPQKVTWTKQFKHPHIVPVLDVGIEQGQPYIVNKYQGGGNGSLRQRLDRLSPQRLNLHEALRIVVQAGQALCYAHDHNILHGNIKPENILFNKQGKVLLTDFHLASFINVMKLNYKSDSHTTCYMAPEQFSGAMSKKSDQYALACLAYELIAGHAPFSAQGFFSMWAKQSTQYATPLSDLVPDLPEPIERAVFKGMAKDPSERYDNVATFLEALETISLSPASVSTKTLIAPANSTLIGRGTKSLEVLENQSSPVTRLSKSSVSTRLLDRPKHVNYKTGKALVASTEPLNAIDIDTEPLNTIDIDIDTDPALVTHISRNPLATRLLDCTEHSNHKTSKTLEATTEPLNTIDIDTDPALVSYLGRKPLATRLLDHPDQGSHKTIAASTDPINAIDIDTDPALSARFSKTPVTTRLLDHPEHFNHDHGIKKASNTKSIDTRIEPLPIGKLPQSGKPVTPTVWLAFALSSIVLLVSTAVLYMFVPLQSSPAHTPIIKKSQPPAKIIPTELPTINPTPTPQPIAKNQATSSLQPKQASVRKSLVSSAQLVQVQPSLTVSYAPQNQTYNLTNEGTLDWIDWGLNTPQDVNRKANVQQHISNFTIIGSCTVQRDSYYSNSNIEWFDGTPQPDTASSQTWGIYVTGINNGFSLTVPASTTPRTLRIYVGAKLARGEFTASLDGKILTDATLDMRDDPNSTQANSIYTVVFNGNAANQVLTVRYTAMATNGSDSYVMLQAATLQ
jgi:serine/threonine protein kinase